MKAARGSDNWERKGARAKMGAGCVEESGCVKATLLSLKANI